MAFTSLFSEFVLFNGNSSLSLGISEFDNLISGFNGDFDTESLGKSSFSSSIFSFELRRVSCFVEDSSFFSGFLLILFILSSGLVSLIVLILLFSPLYIFPTLII